MSRVKNFSDLIEDVVHEIFDYLNGESVLKGMEVCKE